jgi:hypothetical protein
MRNFSRNTTAVLVVTLFTGLAVFSAIQLGGRLFGTSAANAQTVTAQAAQEQGGNGSADGQSSESSSSQGYADPYGQTYSDPYGQSSGSSDGQTYSDPYGQSGSGSGSSSGETMTCPATGCTASSCHATQ